MGGNPPIISLAFTKDMTLSTLESKLEGRMLSSQCSVNPGLNTGAITYCVALTKLGILHFLQPASLFVKE